MKLNFSASTEFQNLLHEISEISSIPVSMLIRLSVFYFVECRLQKLYPQLKTTVEEYATGMKRRTYVKGKKRR